MKTTHSITEDEVREALTEVMDPEIPYLSIVDLGIVRNVDVSGEAIIVELMPTFVGCPALDVMKEGVRERLGEVAPEYLVEIKVTLDEPWTSDRISEKGRAVLKQSGFAPPPLLREMPARRGLIQL